MKNKQDKYTIHFTEKELDFLKSLLVVDRFTQKELYDECKAKNLKVDFHSKKNIFIETKIIKKIKECCEK